MITREDIENIAILSKLFVAEDELDILTKSMQEIIDFADTINNTEVSGEEFDSINNISNSFREDEVVKSYSSDEILKNAPLQEENQFLVKSKE